MDRAGSFRNRKPPSLLKKWFSRLFYCSILIPLVLSMKNSKRKPSTTKPALEEMFRLFMKNSPIYVFFKDDKIRSIQLSDNYEKMLGKPLPELLGKTMDELFPSELARSMVADDLRVLKEGKQITIEEEFNGRFYTTTKFPIHKKGKPSYLAGYTIDITRRKVAEDLVQKTKQELQVQNRMLQEKNIALREIMSQLETEKARIMKQVQSNVETIVLPLIHKIKGQGTENDRNYLRLLEENLLELTSGFSWTLSQKNARLTQREIELCGMIKQGLSCKEIGRLMNISFRTVETHRNRIRKKLGITDQAINLTTYLKNLP